MDEVVCAHLFFLGKRGEADFASDCKTIWEKRNIGSESRKCVASEALLGCAQSHFLLLIGGCRETGIFRQGA
jgi:hypothetical protein